MRRSLLVGFSADRSQVEIEKGDTGEAVGVLADAQKYRTVFGTRASNAS